MYMVERKHQVTCADEGCLKQEELYILLFFFIIMWEQWKGNLVKYLTELLNYLKESKSVHE